MSPELQKQIKLRRMLAGWPRPMLSHAERPPYETVRPLLATDVPKWIVLGVELQQESTRLHVVEVSSEMCLVNAYNLQGEYLSRYACETAILVKYWQPVGWSAPCGHSDCSTPELAQACANLPETLAVARDRARRAPPCSHVRYFDFGHGKMPQECVLSTGHDGLCWNGIEGERSRYWARPVVAFDDPVLGRAEVYLREALLSAVARGVGPDARAGDVFMEFKTAAEPLPLTRTMLYYDRPMTPAQARGAALHDVLEAYLRSVDIARPEDLVVGPEPPRGGREGHGRKRPPGRDRNRAARARVLAEAGVKGE